MRENPNKVESIYCINTISPKTLNVGIGKFEEIEVIQLNLKERELNPNYKNEIFLKTYLKNSLKL